MPSLNCADVLAIAPVPYRQGSRAAHQFGASLFDAALFGGLARRGHPVRVLATRPPNPDGLEPNEIPGVYIEWFVIEWLVFFPAPPSSAVVRARRETIEPVLDRFIAERRPDAVLLGNEAQALYAVDLCRERGLPTILVAHGFPTSGLLEGIYPPRDTELLLEHLARVDVVVTVAHHLETVLRTLGLSNVRAIQTGVDTDAFRPRPKDPGLLARYDIELDRFVVGSFSPMRPGKGLHDVIASAELVVRAEPRTIYLVAGEGPERESLLDLIADKGLGASFRIVDELDHTQVPEHMTLCDATVLASEREGCPLVCLESQACGVATIVGEIPATRELVDDRETGLFFPVGDVEALAARTLEVARDPALRRTLGAGGRARSLAHSSEGWLRGFSDAIAEVAGVPAAR